MNLYQQFEKDRREDTERWQKAVSAGRQLAATLSQLPHENITAYVFYYKDVNVNYYPWKDTEAVRSAVQRVVRVPAQREVNADTGNVSYVFKVPGLVVTVHNGTLAPGCKLVEYQEPVTRYKSVCDDTPTS